MITCQANQNPQTSDKSDRLSSPHEKSYGKKVKGHSYLVGFAVLASAADCAWGQDLIGEVSLFKDEGESGGAEKDSSQGAED